MGSTRRCAVQSLFWMLRWLKHFSQAAMLLKSKVATPPRKRSRNTEHASA
jgi:hypothetical protein